MRLRVTLLRVDEVGELGGVTDEKHGSVVEDPVEVALLRFDLDREPCDDVSLPCTRPEACPRTSRVTGGVRGTRLAANGGEPHGDGGLRADFLEERRAREVGDVVGDFKVPIGARTLRVDNTLCEETLSTMFIV